MTRDEAKVLGPIINAFGEGKTVEWFDTKCEMWREVGTNPIFRTAVKYRIKAQNQDVCGDCTRFSFCQTANKNPLAHACKTIKKKRETKDGKWYVSKYSDGYYMDEHWAIGILFEGSHEECVEWIKKRETEEGYRPFRDYDELLNTCGTKLLWLIPKNSPECEFLITGHEFLEEFGSVVILNDTRYTMKELFDLWTFADGSIIGIPRK